MGAKRAAVWAWALCAAAAWGGTAAEEAVPRAVVYQGVLSDPVEGALEGAQQASFRVFKDASGGDPEWSTDLDVWCGAGGVFHAWLEGDGLMDAFAEPPEAQRFLEVQVEGRGAAIAPRMAFTSVPQALLARWARRSPLAFPVTGTLSAVDAVAVADAAKFGAGASFGELSAVEAVAVADAAKFGAGASFGELSVALRIVAGEDADADSMSDAWERANGLDPTDPADATADLDGDGQTNLAEYRAGTLPWLASDRFGTSALTLTPGGMYALTFPTTYGKVYTVQTAPLALDETGAFAWPPCPFSLEDATAPTQTRLQGTGSPVTIFLDTTAINGLWRLSIQ